MYKKTMPPDLLVRRDHVIDDARRPRPALHLKVPDLDRGIGSNFNFLPLDVFGRIVPRLSFAHRPAPGLNTL
jgi:hypothetical protein